MNALVRHPDPDAALISRAEAQMSAIAPATMARWIDTELTIIAMTKVLTDFVERHGHGMWLEDDAVSFTRAELYNKAGINGWTYAHDAEARKRLRLWFHHVRERETE